jgi:hypothetical protein
MWIRSVLPINPSVNLFSYLLSLYIYIYIYCICALQYDFGAEHTQQSTVDILQFHNWSSVNTVFILQYLFRTELFESNKPWPHMTSVQPETNCPGILRTSITKTDPLYMYTCTILSIYIYSVHVRCRAEVNNSMMTLSKMKKKKY